MYCNFLLVQVPGTDFTKNLKWKQNEHTASFLLYQAFKKAEEDAKTKSLYPVRIFKLILSQ